MQIKKKIGIVIGFVNHTRAIDTGKFALNKTANTAANNICNGIGIHAKNNPIETAREIVYLLKYHIHGL